MTQQARKGRNGEGFTMPATVWKHLIWVFIALM